MEDTQKWNFEGCHILWISIKFGFVKKTNTFGLESSNQMLGRKTKRRQKGSRRKDRPSSSQEDRTICNCKRKTNNHTMEETGTNVNRDKREL